MRCFDREAGRLVANQMRRDADLEENDNIQIILNPYNPSLTLDLSWKTDFAQVEADQEQVNLTRFNLFFPEKRDFFLEGEGRAWEDGLPP